MWFADVGLPLAWTLLAGCGAAVVLFAVQAGVVDRVEDLRGPGALDRSALAWALTHRSPAATLR